MSSKKCSSSSNVDEDSLSSIGDIPVILLRQISNFLSRSQRSFFAAALSSHAAGKSILFPPQHWTALDFLDVKENDLLSRLTDTDLASVLTCISTVSKLERLQLTCCTNINGCGLQPIAHSVVLKQLDLSLLHPDPWKDNEEAGALSADIVLPILESVIGTEYNSLKVLRLPKSWRQNKDSALTEFLERGNITGCRSQLATNASDIIVGHASKRLTKSFLVSVRDVKGRFVRVVLQESEFVTTAGIKCARIANLLKIAMNVSAAFAKIAINLTLVTNVTGNLARNVTLLDSAKDVTNTIAIYVIHWLTALNVIVIRIVRNVWIRWKMQKKSEFASVAGQAIAMNVAW
eukprot:scaffold15969_cov44-Cyclotella_meneghiniana.AAC.1